MPLVCIDADLADSLVYPVKDSMSRPDDRPGTHTSAVIQHIGTSLGLAQKAPSPVGHLFAIVGIAWEAWVLSRLGTRDYIWGLALEKDGLTGTLDAYHLTDSVVIECKATWSSQDKDIRDNWRYMMQVKSYCAMTGTRFARMYILYLKPIPNIVVYNLEFTEEELVENWQMLINAKDHMESQNRDDN